MSFRSRRDRIAFEHPAIFPERLAEDHMRAWSNASGVTLLATPSITHGTLLFGLIRYNFGKALVRLFDRVPRPDSPLLRPLLYVQAAGSEANRNDH